MFHYSGHGSQQRNYNRDERDGYDETICPLDFVTQGMIVDDEINTTIVRPLPSGVKLHAIVDACHSGTVLDLPFLCRMDRSVASHSYDFLLFRVQRALRLVSCQILNQDSCRITSLWFEALRASPMEGQMA